MREVLLDLIRHTGGLGFLDTVKVFGTADKTEIESMDNDRTVILKATLKTPVPDLVGEFGMTRFNILQGFLGFANYRTDSSSIRIKTKERAGGKTVPEELVFSDGQGQSSTYRFMSADLIPEQAKFLGTSWDVEVEPSRSKILEFIQMSSILNSIEHYFLVKTVDNSLRFYIGDEQAATDRACVIIEPDLKTGTLSGELYWDSVPIAPILKLGLDENVKLHFSNRGALQISMSSSLADYKFICPAKRK